MSDLADDDEISPAEQAAWDAWADHEERLLRINRWKAAWMLLTTRQEDMRGVGLAESVGYKILCLICLALWWRGAPEEGHNAFNMGGWDYRDDGYFWNAYFLSFHPQEFRVEIISDGDGESPYGN